ncbi:MAG: DUF192 domain-containing protein [Raoultibacter sp.]
MGKKIVVTDLQGNTLFPQGHILNNLPQRVVGLMGRRSVSPCAAYVFPRCNSVHSCFMRLPIDVVSLDDSLCVLAVETLYPWHICRPVPRTKSIMELAAHGAAARNITPGARLRFLGDEREGF